MQLPISTQINIWGQTLKEFDYWLIFADFESHSCFQQSPLSDNGTMHLRRSDSKTTLSGVIETFTDNLQGNDD